MEAILIPSASPATRARAAGAALWTGRVLGALVTLFLLVDAGGKILELRPYMEGTAKAGFPLGTVLPMGLVLLACTVLYAVPRTALLGAVLLTAYLGGATATHVRLEQAYVFPVVFGVLVWVSLYLRSAHAREVIRSALGIAGTNAR
ncbi:MAG TPA: DoxX family protein [Polyangiaceae bacterium]|jgi:hypothetical protein